MTITLKQWNHPTTGETRVYISGLIAQRGDKVFVVAKTADPGGFEYDILAQVAEGSLNRRGALVDAAEEAIFAAAGSRVKKFEDVLKLAK